MALLKMMSVAIALAVAAIACGSADAPSVTGTTTGDAQSSTTTPDLEKEPPLARRPSPTPRAAPISDDHLRAALPRVDELDGDWTEEFSRRNGQCNRGIRPAALHGTYTTNDGFDSVTIRFHRFSSAVELPANLNVAVRSWHELCIGGRDGASPDVTETGQIKPDQLLDLRSDTTFALLTDDILVLVEYIDWPDDRPLHDGGDRAIEVEPPSQMLHRVMTRLENALIELPSELPQHARRSVTPTHEPRFTRLDEGCFSTPALPSGYLDIVRRRPRGAPKPGPHEDFDLNGDGRADRIVSHNPAGSDGFVGQLQANLGPTLGWTSFMTEYPTVPYSFHGIADLDGDADDEVLLLHHGNNFAGIVIVDLDDCDLRLARSSEFDDEALFLQYCSSISCVSQTTRLDCISGPTGDRLREHHVAVRPEQVDDGGWGDLDSADRVYTIRETRLVDGVMLVVDEKVSAIATDEPLPSRWDSGHFIESCGSVLTR